MAAYPQRVDLSTATQAPAAATGQPYGQAGQQEAAQRALPLPKLDGPTKRPNEPITAGMPTGPGPNPVQAGVPAGPIQSGVSDQAVGDFFRAIYAMYPTDDLADLIASLGDT